MDNWLLWDIMVKQSAADHKHWAHRRAAVEMAAEAGKGRLRGRLASLLARAAIYLDRDVGRGTLASAPNH
jgi:hypothetical protein